MPKGGLEPPRVSPTDFETAVSAIPPLRLGLVIIAAGRELCQASLGNVNKKETTWLSMKLISARAMLWAK